ncbi:TPA: hypothetical protein ACH3X1_014469 [Trebouxia sp. C0004]
MSCTSKQWKESPQHTTMVSSQLAQSEPQHLSCSYLACGFANHWSRSQPGALMSYGGI